MNGFYVNKSSASLSVSTGEVDLALLAKRPDMEVMTQKLKKDAVVWIDPADDKDTLEFFYVLSGELLLMPDTEKQHLRAGDSFYTDGLTKSVLIHVVKEAHLLYLTNRPMFDDVLSFQGDFSALMHQVDDKDNYTYRHSRNVMNYSLLLFRRLAPEGLTIEEITTAALFHDIGKCMLPDEILNKPAKLTESEFIQIRKHPLFSANILRGRFGDRIADMVLQHHERLDGSGYPCHLNDADISMGGRIIAVADSFDAMTSRRVYTDRVKTPEESVEELCSMSERYDTRVTDVLKALYESGEIFEVDKL